MADSILRLPKVEGRVGLSRSAIYLAIQRKEFPSPIPIGARAVGWLESEIAEWLTSCIAKRVRKE
jgi:prophage regulatory protein